MKLPSVRKIYDDAKTAFGRFPLAILSALITTTAGIIILERVEYYSRDSFIPLVLSGILGVFMFFGIAMFAESAKLSLKKRITIDTFGVILLILFYCVLPSNISHQPVYHLYLFFMLLVGLCFAIMTAPYLTGTSDDGIWYYNMNLLTRLALSVFSTMVLYIGLLVALISLNILFKIEIPYQRYPELFVLLAGIFGTVFFMSGAPERFDTYGWEEFNYMYIKLFVQYILLPVLGIYLIIMYLYIGKIIANWAWPDGWLSKLILGYAIIGLAALLLVHPLKENPAEEWIKHLWKWFLISLIPLELTYFLAMVKRVNLYGLTEGRVLGFIMCFWLLAVVIYYLFSRKKNIKLIPASLMALTILFSLGPWSIFSISERAQVSRLKAVLEKDSILVNGKIQKAKSKIADADAIRISNILDYLRETHGYDKVQPWFQETLKDTSSEQNKMLTNSIWLPASEVTKKMEVDYTQFTYPAEHRKINLSISDKSSVDISGFEKMTAEASIYKYIQKKEGELGDFSYLADDDFYRIQFSFKSSDSLNDKLDFDLKPFIEALGKECKGWEVDLPQEKLSILKETKLLKAKLLFTNIGLENKDSKLKVTHCSFRIFYALKK